MSAQDTVKKAIDAVNRHDASAFAALYDAEAVALDPQYAEPLQGREAIRKDIEDFFLAFPDLQVKASNILASGDTIAFEVEMSGTHKGPIIIPGGIILATDQRMAMRGGRFIRLNEQNLITECRRYFDIAGLMQQLGLM